MTFRRNFLKMKHTHRKREKWEEGEINLSTVTFFIIIETEVT